MMQTLNALCVLMSLIGVGALTAGWLITIFSSLFTRRWLTAILSIILPLAPIIAYRQQHKHALIMLGGGIILLILSTLGIVWIKYAS